MTLKRSHDFKNQLEVILKSRFVLLWKSAGWRVDKLEIILLSKSKFKSCIHSNKRISRNVKRSYCFFINKVFKNILIIFFSFFILTRKLITHLIALGKSKTHRKSELNSFQLHKQTRRNLIFYDNQSNRNKSKRITRVAWSFYEWRRLCTDWVEYNSVVMLKEGNSILVSIRKSNKSLYLLLFSSLYPSLPFSHTSRQHGCRKISQ